MLGRESETSIMSRYVEPTETKTNANLLAIVVRGGHLLVRNPLLGSNFVQKGHSDFTSGNNLQRSGSVKI